MDPLFSGPHLQYFRGCPGTLNTLYTHDYGAGIRCTVTAIEQPASIYTTRRKTKHIGTRASREIRVYVGHDCGQRGIVNKANTNLFASAANLRSRKTQR